MNQNYILNMLRTPNAILVVLVLALVAQLPHAADVFRLIVHGAGWAVVAHSYSFAIALELAVLLFVVQNRHVESYGFAGVSIAMNISYYYLHNVQLFSLAALPAILVSVALPIAIARYSHAVAEVQPVQDEDAQDTKPTRTKRQAEAPKATTPDAQSNNDNTTTVQPEDAQPGNPDKRQRAHQLRDEGLTIAQIADELGAHRNTVGAWLRTNGHKEPAH